LTRASQDFQVLRVNTRLSSVQCLTFRSCYGFCGPINRLYPLASRQNIRDDGRTASEGTASDDRRGCCLARAGRTARTGVRRGSAGSGQNVPCGGWGWRCDTDGRLRHLASLGGTRGIPGQAVEPGTSGCCAVDLAADRVELPRRRYHVDIGNPCGISNCRTGRRTSPALDRRLPSAACRQHAVIGG
jgi:hypothetical protein